MRVLPIASAVAMLLAACSSSSTTTTTDTGTTVAPVNTATPSDLRDRSREFMAAWNQEDAGVVVAFYTPNAVVTQGDSTFAGTERIRTNFVADLGAVTDLTISEQTFTGSGDHFVERGSYRFMGTMDGQTRPVSGTYETTWHKEDGRWMIMGMKVHQDM